MIQTGRSATRSGLLHSHHSVLKQIKLFGSDSQELEANTCRYTPFPSIPVCVKRFYPHTTTVLHNMLCIHTDSIPTQQDYLPRAKALGNEDFLHR